MARWGSVDFENFKKLQKNLERLEKVDIDKFCRDMAKEVTARLLRKVISRTPTITGTLRRGWTVDTQEEAESGVEVSSAKYLNGVSVERSGNDYIIEVFNPVEYASYVEYGHRFKGGNGWRDGRKMLTISVSEVEGITPKLIEKRLEEKIKEVFK